MSMPIHDLLFVRRTERTALLQRALRILEQDERIRAAWLFGSLGRGDEDDLSDIDLFTVTADEHLATLAANRHDYVSRLARPLLLLDAPRNAPPGGAYLMAIYDGEAGPQQVDWYWQPQSLARVPQQTLLLFEHDPLPRLQTPPEFGYQPVPERSPLEAASHAIDSFWVALLITAKGVARAGGVVQAGWQEWVRGSLQAVQGFLGIPPDPARDGDSLLTDPLRKLAILRDLARTMEPLMERIPAPRGERSPEFVGRSDDYLRMIEALVEAERMAAGSIPLRRSDSC